MNQKAIQALENKVRRDCPNIAGILITQHGQPVYEAYFQGCAADSRVHIYSVTKSILSLLIGIAIDQGAISSVHRSVLDFFPEYKIPASETSLPSITLEHLLTMTAPYRYQTPPYEQYFQSSDFVQFTLGLLGGRETTGSFQYAPLIGPDLLSGILVRSTGLSVLDFAVHTLFSPLNISVERSIVFHSLEEQLAFNQPPHISGWVSDQAGHNTGGWGLTLTCRDMAKIGQLTLNHGQWKGKQLISPAWIQESTREHSRWTEQNLPYGYLWWIVDPKARCYAAIGDGGNVIYVNAQRQAVVSIASFFEPQITDRIELIQRFIEPYWER